MLISKRSSSIEKPLLVQNKDAVPKTSKKPSEVLPSPQEKSPIEIEMMSPSPNPLFTSKSHEKVANLDEFSDLLKSQPSEVYTSLEIKYPELENLPEIIYTPTSEMKNFENLMQQNPEFSKMLRERDEIISGLNNYVLKLKKRNFELENNFEKLKKLLKSKEQECAEYHCLKIPQKEKDVIEELMASQSSSEKIIVFERNEAKSDNDKLIKKLCLSDEGVLFESDLLRIVFTSEVHENEVKMKCVLENTGNQALTHVNIEHSNITVLEIHILNTDFAKILPNQQAAFEVFGTYFMPTHVLPIIKLTFNCDNETISYHIKLPITQAKFSEKIFFSGESLFDLWEENLFYSESFTGSVFFNQKFLPGLLKFSENVLIFSSENFKKLKKNQYFIGMKLKNVVMGLVTVNEENSTCTIEGRCSQENLRKNFMIMVANQITD